MKRALLVLLLLGLGSCRDIQNPVEVEPDLRLQEAGRESSVSQVIPDRYIVVFNNRVPDPPGEARNLVQAWGGSLHYTYQHALKGFAATLPLQAVEAIRNHPGVDYVEPDGEVHAVGSGSQSGATWGLDRIDQRSGLNSTYTWNTSGDGVTVYVLDTGIRYSHNDFGGRATFGFDAFDDGQNGEDCAGHGTHVAGTVGGATWGVAKDVDLVAVRVLNCTGSGSTSGVIAGIDWVTANFEGPSVANMSLSGWANSALDSAVRNSIVAGVTFAVAASNDNINACYFSPARVSEAMTVGATDSSDRRASFSNYGSCVDLFAPGVNIQSAYHTSDIATAYGSGTSMASPHVAGVAALYLEENPSASPAQVFAAIDAGLTRGIVTDSRSANNHLLYSLITTGAPPPNKPPTADFSSSCHGLDCDFTDQSSDSDGSVVAWVWDFGDGNGSTDQNPSHSYSAAGTYSVVLTVTDDDGDTDSANQDVTVAEPTPNNPPTADFTFAVDYLDVDFTDASTDADGSVVAWSWEFGDGNSSSAQNPSHSYAAAGTYAVKLTVTDNDGATDNVTKDVTVTDPPNQPPTADFGFSCTGLICDFTDKSFDGDGSVVAWSWDFGDGNGSTAPNPSHSYATAGTYSVSLTVTDDDGATGTATQSVTVTDPPELSLSASGRKTRGSYFADLAWSPTGPGNVDIYRNGVLHVTTANDGSHTDSLGKKVRGLTFSYQVCLAGTATCSNVATVRF